MMSNCQQIRQILSKHNLKNPVFQRLICKSVEQQQPVDFDHDDCNKDDSSMLVMMLDSVTQQLIKYSNQVLFCKYSKMKKFGVSDAAICQRMAMDGHSIDDISQFCAQMHSAQARDELEQMKIKTRERKINNVTKQRLRILTKKYTKMLCVGVPKQSVLNAMIIDGMNNKFIKQFFKKFSSVEHTVTVRTSECKREEEKEEAEAEAKTAIVDTDTVVVKRGRQRLKQLKLQLQLPVAGESVTSNNNFKKNSKISKNNDNVVGGKNVSRVTGYMENCFLESKGKGIRYNPKTRMKRSVADSGFSNGGGYVQGFNRDGLLSKYWKMSKYGLSEASIAKQMKIDGKIINSKYQRKQMDFKKFAKYKQMQRARVPDSSIRHKMKLDRMDTKFIACFFGETTSML